MRHVTPLLLTLLAASACHATHEIDDAGMQATAAQLGSSSGQMAAMPADADDSTIQGQVQAVGGNLQSLVSQHQAYASSNPNAVDEIDRDGLEQDSTGTVSWDGSHLVVDTTWESTGFSWVYDVDLQFASGDAGTSIDGRFDLSYALDVSGFRYDYTTHGSYDALTLDGSGCASSGSIQVDWDLDYDVSGFDLPGQSTGASKGTVIVTFDGCNVVVVEGT
jgi:hypothetical protein